MTRDRYVHKRTIVPLVADNLTNEEQILTPFVVPLERFGHAVSRLHGLQRYAYPQESLILLHRLHYVHLNGVAKDGSSLSGEIMVRRRQLDLTWFSAWNSTRIWCLRVALSSLAMRSGET